MGFLHSKYSTYIYILLTITVLAISFTAFSSTDTVTSITSEGPLNTITGYATAQETDAQTADLQTDLQAYYRFDNPKASRGYSLEFDGNDDRIDVGDPLSTLSEPSNDSRSVFGWVKFNSFQNEYTAFFEWKDMEGENEQIGASPSGNAKIATDGVRTSSEGSALSTDTWYHLGYVWNGDNYTVYLNGEKDYTVDPDGDDSWMNALNTSAIGTGLDGPINGRVDDVRVYTREFSQFEVKSLYQEKPVSDSGLVLYQQFNRGPKSCDITAGNACLQDSSANDNDTTPHGFNDNDLDTGTGWTKETPVNRPSFPDSSARSRDGSLYNGVDGTLQNFNFNSSSGWTTGKIGSSALNFDGNDDFVELDAVEFPEKEGTISAWVNLEDNGDEHIVIYSGTTSENGCTGRESIELSTCAGLAMDNNNSNNEMGVDKFQTDLPADFTYGEWHLLTGTWNSVTDEAKLYVDGQLVDTTTFTFYPDINQEITHIGRPASSTRYTQGKVDDIRIYNRPLSSSEVSSLYNEKKVANGLLNQWNFEESDRSKVYDTSDLGHSGILDTDSVRAQGNINISGFEPSLSTIEDSITISSWYKTNEPKFGDGSDGDVTISSDVELDSDLQSNGRSQADAVGYVVKDLGSTSIDTFSTPDGISSEDQVIVVNLQGTPSNYEKVGNYEFLRVKSVNLTEKKIALEDKIAEEYGNPEYQNVIVQRVPEYESLTVDGGELTVSDWNHTAVETCPSGWSFYSGECYQQVSSDTWSGTRSQCREYGGDLARIDSSGENSFVSDNFPDSWIGFRDISGSNDGGNDGSYEWVWTVGDYYDYKNFASNEPSIGGVDHNPTVRINSSGEWYTEFGHNNTYPGVCEMNKKKGGVLSFRASNNIKTINGGLINATGKGYRGGDCSFCGDDADGRAGEGITGTGKYGFYGEVNNVNGGAGAGVNDNDGGDPAGGGGYGTAGGDSDRGHEGGEKVGDPKLRQIYFGGGGGAGSDNDNWEPYSEDSHGGGIIYIASQSTENLTIRNEGIDSYASPDGCAGASGGGAGGTVYTISYSAETSLLNATGGARNYSGGCGQEWSGEGGEGRIRVNSIDQFFQKKSPQPYNTSLIPNLVRKEGEFGIGGYSDIAFGNANNASDAITSISGEKWRNIVLTFNGSTGKIYLDGEYGYKFSKNGIFPTDNYLTIGENLRGKMDEVKIYNRSLSQKEVRRLALR